MTKEIIIKIKGSHFSMGEEDLTEILMPGTYFFKDGKHYLLYDEVMEGFSKKVRNRIVIDRQRVEIHKKGLLLSTMVFEENKMYTTAYRTPFGAMNLNLKASKVALSFGEDFLQIDLRYRLSAGADYFQDCDILVLATSKNKGIDF